MNKLTVDEFVKRAREVHGDKYCYDLVRYSGTNQKVTIICPEHGQFKMRAAKHMQGRGCRECTYAEIGSERRLGFWEFVDAVMSTHGAFKFDYQLRDHVNQNSKIHIRCPKHGWFKQPIAAHMHGHGCEACVQSKSERKVRETLVSLDINFVEQARFPSCRNKRALPFDFYLPEHQLLIECDGSQHYVSSENWGGEEKLAQVQRHDAIKNRFAAKAGIRLLRIPYWDFSNIEDLVIDALMECETSQSANDLVTS